jgi:type I restriction enzyme S subunit
MNAKQLKNSILQMAVQGKLVPQDPNDEPASVLLGKIRAEKQKLIKAGKIKREKSESVIFRGSDNLPYAKPGCFYERTADGKVRDITDELPFEIPDNWEWVSIDNIGEVGSSKRVYTSEFVNDGIPFFRGTEIGALATGQAITPKYFITEKHYQSLLTHSGKPNIGDLLMPSICPDGRIWLVDTDRQFYFKDGRVLWIHFNCDYFDKYFVQIALKARLINDYTSIATGTTFSELKIFLLKEIVIPLPPIAEQQRIVARIEELLPHIVDYDAAEKRLV